MKKEIRSLVIIVILILVLVATPFMAHKLFSENTSQIVGKWQPENLASRPMLNLEGGIGDPDYAIEFKGDKSVIIYGDGPLSKTLETSKARWEMPEEWNFYIVVDGERVAEIKNLEPGQDRCVLEVYNDIEVCSGACSIALVRAEE